MSEQARLILTAFSFLTRIPVRGGTSEVERSAGWFPLVGLVIGALVGLVHVGLSEVTSPLVAASVAVALGVGISGAFHEDGLGDMADGFGGGWTREQRLEIMKDSRLGTYGVLAIVSTFVIRVSALSVLAGWRAVALVAVVHSLSRTWAMVALGLARRAKSDGLAVAAAAPHRAATLPLVAIAWFAVGVLLIGPGSATVVGLVGVVGAAATVALAYRKIGGVTGDVLGAAQQIAEAGGLVAATLAWGT